MSTSKIVAGLALASACFSTAVMAEGGTVKFNGDIVNTPCVVDSGSKDQTVTLDTVKASFFKAVGDTGAYKSFVIKLDDCTPDTIKNANVTFTGSTDGKSPDLLSIVSGTGTASGVAIQLADNAEKAIPVGTASADTVLATGPTTLTYKARYKSTAAAVTPGAANSQADFVVAYK